VHRDQDLGTDCVRQEGGFAFVHVSDYSVTLPEPIAPIDGQERDIDPERLQPVDHSRINRSVARVVNANASNIDDKSDKAPSCYRIGFPNTLGDRISSRSVCSRDGMDGHGPDFYGLVDLAGDNSLVVVYETHCLRDGGFGYHENRPGGCLRDPFDCERIQVIQMIVAAEHDVETVEHSRV